MIGTDAQYEVRKDMTGLRVGKLTVVSLAPRMLYRGALRPAWRCRCDCGSEVTVQSEVLRRKEKKSCGCMKEVGRPVADLTGKVIGAIAVVKRGPSSRNPDNSTTVRWWCICGECGNGVLLRYTTLCKKDRPPYSCGCKRKNSSNIYDRLYKVLRYNAESEVRRGLKWTLTQDQMLSLVLQNCHYCGIPPSTVFKVRKEEILRNGIDRKDNAIGYVLENCVPCCGHCNAMKLTLSYEQFLDKITYIYKNLCTKRQAGVLQAYRNPGAVQV